MYDGQIPNELTFYLKLDDAIVIVDENCLIIEVNKKYEKTTGNNRESIIGLPVECLNLNEMNPLIMNKLNITLSNGDQLSRILKNLKKSTELRYYYVTIIPIKINKKVYYVGIIKIAEQIALKKENQKEQQEQFRVIALSSEMRDSEIARHLFAVQKLTEKFLLCLNEDKRYTLSVEYINKVINASILHDIGKSSIPESILYKPGTLTFVERKIIETHTLIGVDILRKISNNLNIDDITIANNIIKFHHEKWDGTGYPVGLKGIKIPFEARVLAIVDVYVALISKRIYRDKWSQQEAISYLKKQSGIHFDPDLVETFINKVINANYYSDD